MQQVLDTVLKDIEPGRDTQCEALRSLTRDEGGGAKKLGLSRHLLRVRHVGQGEIWADSKRVFCAPAMHRKVREGPTLMTSGPTNKSEPAPEQAPAQTAELAIDGIDPALHIGDSEVRRAVIGTQSSVRNGESATVPRSCGKTRRDWGGEEFFKHHGTRAEAAMVSRLSTRVTVGLRAPNLKGSGAQRMLRHPP